MEINERDRWLHNRLVMLAESNFQIWDMLTLICRKLDIDPNVGDEQFSSYAELHNMEYIYYSLTTA